MLLNIHLFPRKIVDIFFFSEMFNRLELLEEERNTKKKRNQRVRVRQKKDNIGNLDIL